MNILTIIAVIAGVLLALNMFWTPITNLIKKKTPQKIDNAIDDMSQLRANLNAWIVLRMLPGLSDKAIDLLEKLKTELLKYDSKDSKDKE